MLLFLLLAGAVGVYFAIGFWTLIRLYFETAPEERHRYWDRYDTIFWSPWVLWILLMVVGC